MKNYNYNQSDPDEGDINPPGGTPPESENK